MLSEAASSCRNALISFCRTTGIPAIVFSLALANSSAYGQASEDEEHAFRSMDEHVFQSHLKFLADDLLEGRAPATRGDAVAEKYLVAQLQLIGLEPGGKNGTYLQQFPVLGSTASPSMELDARCGANEERFRFREDFVGFSGVNEADIDIANREVVFVRYGSLRPRRIGTTIKALMLLAKSC